MNRTITITLAVMLAIFINSTGYAQQPASAYRFAAVLASGANVGGQVLPADTTVDNTVFADSGAFAAAVHWADPIGAEHSAIVTPQRIVAGSNDATVDGKTILRITSAAMAMNNAGVVAFEASYVDYAAGGTTGTGVFIERRLAVPLGPGISGTAADFQLTDDGRVLSKFAVVPVATPPPAATPSQTSLAGGVGCSAKPNKPSLKDTLIKHSGKFGDIVSAVVPDCPDNNAQPPKPSSAAQPAPTPATTAVAPARPAVACGLPPFPIPPEWQVGADMSGPIMSGVFDSALNGRGYYSPFFGQIAAPWRTVQFGPTCKPILVSVGDTTNRSHMEFWTPAGPLMFTRPDGSLELNGFAGKALPGNLARADTPIRVNRRGQVLMPVTTGGSGFAILLANPLGGTH